MQVFISLKRLKAGASILNKMTLDVDYFRDSVVVVKYNGIVSSFD